MHVWIHGRQLYACHVWLATVQTWHHVLDDQHDHLWMQLYRLRLRGFQLRDACQWSRMPKQCLLWQPYLRSQPMWMRVHQLRRHNLQTHASQAEGVHLPFHSVAFARSHAGLAHHSLLNLPNEGQEEPRNERNLQPESSRTTSVEDRVQYGLEETTRGASHLNSLGPPTIYAFQTSR